MKSPRWFLSNSSKTRYSTGALAYFAQGIPMGLLHISLPAWLAVEGVSATQFAIYMSVSNLGATLGSIFYGMVAGYTSWSQNYALMGFLVFLLLLSILMYRSHGHPEALLEDGAPE